MAIWVEDCPNVSIETSHRINNVTDIVRIIFQQGPSLNKLNSLRNKICDDIKLTEFLVLQDFSICNFLSVNWFPKESLVCRLKEIQLITGLLSTNKT
jgi:hypothetical protein